MYQTNKHDLNTQTDNSNPNRIKSAMSSGLFYESESEKSRNRKVIEQLLDDFDMEETVTHYATLDAVEVVYDTSEFSVNSSLSTLRIKQKLHKLMGTDVIRLNDRQYSDKLRRKLQEEYESNMDKKEKELAEAEVQRVRKLMLDGVIPMKKGKTKGYKASKKSNSNKHKTKNAKNNKENISIMHSESVFHTKAGRTRKPDEKEKLEETSDGEHQQECADERKIIIEQACIDKIAEVVTQVQLVEQMESKSEEGQKPEEETINDPDNAETHSQENIPSTGAHIWKRKRTNSFDRVEDTEIQKTTSPVQEQRGYIDEQSVMGPGQTTDDQRSMEQQQKYEGKFSLKDSEKMQQLRQEETIDGLYKLAEKLVV